jgi:hypothetical protein
MILFGYHHDGAKSVGQENVYYGIYMKALGTVPPDPVGDIPGPGVLVLIMPFQNHPTASTHPHYSAVL